jgi:hypothetical protein
MMSLLVSTGVGLVLTFEHTGLVPCALTGTGYFFNISTHGLLILCKNLFFAGLTQVYDIDLILRLV